MSPSPRRDKSEEMTSELTHVDRQLRTLGEKSTKISTDLVSLKTHQQRSVESSSTLQQQILQYEGKLEQITSNLTQLCTFFRDFWPWEIVFVYIAVMAFLT